jgi:hypothetical protein
MSRTESHAAARRAAARSKAAALPLPGRTAFRARGLLLAVRACGSLARSAPAALPFVGRTTFRADPTSPIARQRATAARAVRAASGAPMLIASVRRARAVTA